MLRLSPKRLLLLSALLVMLLAGWLYWHTLRLPLFYDTLLHMRIVGDLTWRSVWLPTEAFGFYRPLVFFPMLVIERLFDGYPAWLLHGNNLLQHMVNTGLLVWLSWRLWPDWRRAAAAGAIFAVNPFSYRVVPVYGNNVYLAMTGLMLWGLHGYVTAVSPPNPRKWWLFTWVLFVMMVLKQETAVLFGPFAALVHLNHQPEALGQWLHLLRHKDWRAIFQLPWVQFILAGLLYLVVYQFFPISRAPLVDAANNSLWLNWLYLLQAAVFPLAWFAHLLPGVSGTLVTLASGGRRHALAGLAAAGLARPPAAGLGLVGRCQRPRWADAAYRLFAPRSAPAVFRRCGRRAAVGSSAGRHLVWANL